MLGAGAAGLICAIEAGKRGRRVLLLERNQRIGRKIIISGGGRCNFTNLYAQPEAYICGNPDFHRSALARYTPGDFIALVEAHGIAYHEKKLGQLFCDGASQQIVDMLARECADAGVDVLTGCDVRDVERPGGYEVMTSRGNYAAPALVLATGGLSIPKIGATDFAQRTARRFGLALTEMRPGLVPLTFDGEDLRFCTGLSGVSFDARVACNGQSFRENVLFTHRGLSGPAVLQISSYWREGDEIDIDLLPEEHALELLQRARGTGALLVQALSPHLPRRFAQAWCERYSSSRALDQLSGRDLEALAQRLHCWRLRPSGTEGYAKAEVTVGGVDTRELSSRTMEARSVPGLYVIGEAVDVTGWLGGYNFQWAWASGYAAGQAV